MPRFSLAIIFALTTGCALQLAAVDFVNDIKPILSQNCYECHSETRKKEKGGFVFDNLKRFAHDIGTNLNIEPGRPGSSHFFEVISDPDVKNHMPPKGSLSKADQEKIRQWIAEGAAFDANAPKLAMKKDLPPIMKWTNAEGVSIKAGFGGVNGQSVIFKMPNGTKVEYPIAKLSPESQKLVEECAAP